MKLKLQVELTNIMYNSNYTHIQMKEIPETYVIRNDAKRL